MACVHFLALITPADRRADLARDTGAYVTRLVDFLLRRRSART
jgi:hypothetical protein